MDPVPISRIIIYVGDIPKVAAFYQTHFGLRPLPSTEAGWLELDAPCGGCRIALHQAAISQKRGSEIKIVFAVKDVAKFIRERAAFGLKFGVVHNAGSHDFANTRDPAGNSIQVSSRGLK